jgi:hypothetical protein
MIWTMVSNISPGVYTFLSYIKEYIESNIEKYSPKNIVLYLFFTSFRLLCRCAVLTPRYIVQGYVHYIYIPHWYTRTNVYSLERAGESYRESVYKPPGL